MEPPLSEVTLLSRTLRLSASNSRVIVSDRVRSGNSFLGCSALFLTVISGCFGLPVLLLLGLRFTRYEEVPATITFFTCASRAFLVRFLCSSLWIGWTHLMRWSKSNKQVIRRRATLLLVLGVPLGGGLKPARSR